MPYGGGYIGVGKHRVGGRPLTKSYSVWTNMLRRCYHSKTQRIQPTYKGCEVCDEWKNYQIFAQWHVENYTEGFQLDKDILSPGNKIYSPEFCIYIPQWLNKLFGPKNAHKALPVGVGVFEGRYRAQIGRFGETVYLGSFGTVEEARVRYLEARRKYLIDCSSRDDVPEVLKPIILNIANSLKS